jgi:hydroxymethylglutaryl-CoA reductase
MKHLTSKIWWQNAGVRALKTVAQTMVATIGTAAVLESVDWKMAVSAAVLAGGLSLLTSLAGLPETDAANTEAELVNAMPSETEPKAGDK